MSTRAKKGAKGRLTDPDDDDVVIVKEIVQKKDAKVKEVKPSTSKGTAEAPRYELRSRAKKEEVVSEVDALAVEFAEKAVVKAPVNAEGKAKRRPTGAEKEEPEGSTGVKAKPRYKLRSSDAKNKEEPGTPPEVTVEPSQSRYKLRSSDAKNKEEHEASVGKAGAKSLLVQKPETKEDLSQRSKSLEAVNSRPLGPSARNKKQQN